MPGLRCGERPGQRTPKLAAATAGSQLRGRCAGWISITLPRRECTHCYKHRRRPGRLDDRAGWARTLVGRRRTPSLEWIEGRPSEDSTPSPPAGQAQAARAAAGEAARAAEAAGHAPRGRPSDVFGGEVRRRDIFTLLVLHLIARAESGASYGNQLIEQIEAITRGAVSLNPNTMYPLLRELEGAGPHRGPVGASREAQPPPVHAHRRGPAPSTTACSRAWSRSSTRSSTASRLIKQEIYGSSACRRSGIGFRALPGVPVAGTRAVHRSAQGALSTMFVFKSRRRRRRHDGRRDRPDARRRRPAGRAQGRRPEVRRPGPREGPPGHRGPAPGPRRRRRRSPRSRPRQKLEHTLGLITGTTDYDGFGDVDFVVEAVPERIEIKRQVFAELDAATPGSRDPGQQHLLALDHRDGRRDAAARQGGRLPLLLSRLGDAADRGGRGRGDLRGDDADDRQLRAADPQDADPLRRGARASSSTASSTRPRARSGATRTSPGVSAQDIDKEIADARVTPMGPFFLSDLLGLDTVLHVAEHLQESYGDRFYVSPEMQELVAAGNFGQKTGKGFYEHAGERELMEQATAQQTGAIVERFTLKAFVEACLVLEEGVASLQGHRDRDDDRRRHPAGAVRARRRARARRDAGRARARARRSGASASRRRRSCAASSRRGGSARRPARASSPTRSRTPTSTRRRPCCSRRAATVAIIWLNRPPANPLSPQLIKEFGELWKHCHESDEIRSVVIASIEHLHVLGRRRHQGVHEDGRLRRRGPARLRPRDAARDGDVEHDDDRGREQHRVRRRLRAVDGVRLPPRGRVGDVRPARDQPRHHPRLRRHAAAAAARGRGQGARDEPDRRRDPRPRRPTASGSPTRSCPTTSCSTRR